MRLAPDKQRGCRCNDIVVNWWWKRHDGGGGGVYTCLLAVDSDGTVDDHLASLSRTAGKEGSEDGDIKASLERRKGHLLVRCGDLPARVGDDFLARPFTVWPVRLVGWGLCEAGTAAGGLFAAVVSRHVPRVHVDDSL